MYARARPHDDIDPAKARSVSGQLSKYMAKYRLNSTYFKNFPLKEILQMNKSRCTKSQIKSILKEVESGVSVLP